MPIGMSRLVRAELLGSHTDLDLRSASLLERQLDELRAAAVEVTDGEELAWALEPSTAR